MGSYATLRCSLPPECSCSPRGRFLHRRLLVTAPLVAWSAAARGRSNNPWWLTRWSRARRGAGRRAARCTGSSAAGSAGWHRPAGRRGAGKWSKTWLQVPHALQQGASLAVQWPCDNAALQAKFAAVHLTAALPIIAGAQQPFGCSASLREQQHTAASASYQPLAALHAKPCFPGPDCTLLGQGMQHKREGDREAPPRLPTSNSTLGHSRPVQRRGMGTRCFRLKPSPV